MKRFFLAKILFLTISSNAMAIDFGTCTFDYVMNCKKNQCTYEKVEDNGFAFMFLSKNKKINITQGEGSGGGNILTFVLDPMTGAHTFIAKVRTPAPRSERTRQTTFFTGVINKDKIFDVIFSGVHYRGKCS